MTLRTFSSYGFEVNGKLTLRVAITGVKRFAITGAALDQMAIAKRVRELRLPDRVFVYPGADEVGSVLFARVFNQIKNYRPRIYIRYSSVYGPFIVPRYEDGRCRRE